MSATQELIDELSDIEKLYEASLRLEPPYEDPKDLYAKYMECHRRLINEIRKDKEDNQ